MPTNAPGTTHTCRASKATVHGAPVIEEGFPGIAHKSTQAGGAYPNAANALAATRIAVGEEMVIKHMGRVEVDTDLLFADPRRGDEVYITEADNRLVNAAGGASGGLPRAGFRKYGRIEEVDSASGLTTVNLNARSTF